jgi:uncharacterized protein (TIGR03067 family)
MSSKFIVWGTKIEMTRIVTQTGICIVFLLMAGAVQAADLSGTWTGSDDAGASCTFVFTAADWSLTVGDGSEWYDGTYTFNDNTAPKQLDLYVVDSFNEAFIEKTALYIYNIEGDTLTLTGSDPGTAYRPVSFSEGGTTRTFTVANEAPAANDSQDGSTRSDSDDHVEVYLNCFLQTLQN